MGSINVIWNPKYWKFCFEGRSKLIDEDIIYKMIIGEGEDYQNYEIIDFISKDNYDNLIKGNYFIKVFPNSDIFILLFNEEKELIPLVKGMENHYDKLNDIQKDYVNSFIKSRKLCKKK